MLVILFGLGLAVTDIEVEKSPITAMVFVIVAIAAINPIVSAEKVLKIILSLVLLAFIGKLYFFHLLENFSFG